MTKIKRVIEFCNFGILKFFVVLIADFQVSVGVFFSVGPTRTSRIQRWKGWSHRHVYIKTWV